MSTYLVTRSPSSAIEFKTPIDMNVGFNESGEYKKTFIGSGVARDREQHSAWELFSYREDSNEATFAVACEVISKWKVGLKDDMDARSDVYVLNNSCKKYSDDSDGYYWESTPVGSQEYQMVCTRLDIASAYVDMLDKFDRGL
ncbi:hypothetical protein Tco_1498216 [Tanacetum coccineum]